MAEPPEQYIGDGSDDDLLEPIAIKNDVLIELIKNTEQPDMLNVRMVLEEEIDGDKEEMMSVAVSVIFNYLINALIN